MKTNKNTTVVVKSDGLEGFIRRGREHAKALDNGEPLPSEITITFETTNAMMRVFTLKRTELLEKLTREGRQPIQQLATALNRKRTAVNRDIVALEKVGVVSTSSATNPGHGKLSIVSPLAKQYEFIWSVGAKNRRLHE